MKKIFAIGFLATAICDASLGMKNPMLHLSNDSVNADHAVVTGSFNNPENVGKLNSLFAGMNSKEIDELYKSARSEAFEVIASIFLGKANDVVQHVLDRTPLSQSGMLFWTFLNNGQDTLKFIGDIAGIEAPLAIQDWCKPLLNKYEDPRLPLEQIGLYNLNDDQKKILVGIFATVLSNIRDFSLSFQGDDWLAIRAFHSEYPNIQIPSDMWNPNINFDNLQPKVLYNGKLMSLFEARSKFFKNLTKMFKKPSKNLPDNGLRYFVRQLFGI